MKVSFVIVLALALFSLCTASPLLVTKHVVKKVLFKGGLSLLHHHHSKGHSAKTVQEVHYVAVPPPVHTVSHVPVVLPSTHHHGYKHY
uniref:Uncharacterized protein n=1 Tax=Anopheles funestus TaxID=62324 RepID=A0A182R5S9_ANOFN